MHFELLSLKRSFDLILHNFAETNVDTGVKLSKVNQEELDIGDAKDASFDEGKAGQVLEADCYLH